MTYFNQFHKEAMERTMKKIVEFKKSHVDTDERHFRSGCSWS